LIRKLETLTDDAQLHIEGLVDQLRQMPDQCRDTDVGFRLLQGFFQRVRRSTQLEMFPPLAMMTVTLPPSALRRQLTIGQPPMLLGPMHPSAPIMVLPPYAAGLGGLSIKELIAVSDLEKTEPAVDPATPETTPAWVREQLRLVETLAKRRRHPRRPS